MKKFIRTAKSIYIDKKKVQSISYIEIHHSLGFFMENGDSYQVSLSSEITKEGIEKYMPFLVRYCFTKKGKIIDIYEQTQSGFLSSDKALYEAVYKFLLDEVFFLVTANDTLCLDDNQILNGSEILLSEDNGQGKELLHLVKFKHSRVAVGIHVNKDMYKHRKESLIKELERLTFKFNDLDLKIATVTYRD